MLYALPIISLLAFAIAQTSWAQQVGLGALPLAIVMGIIVGNLLNGPVNSTATKALEFSKKRLLRGGIILFGSHLTLQQLWAVGWQAAVLDAFIIVSVLSLGYWFGVKILGMGKEETILTSVGSAVCGAAAILATEPVLKTRQQHVSVAVATVVVFGTLALFCYPIIFHLTDIPSDLFGIFIGSTVHEVAQAVAAGQSIDAEAMNNAIIVKLMRVMMLAPVVVVIAWLYQRKSGNGHSTTSGTIPWPWFVLGFVGMVVVNSLIDFPVWAQESLKLTAQVLLTIAMTALGLQTKFSAIRQAGMKPMLLSSMLFVLLIGGGLTAHSVLY